MARPPSRSVRSQQKARPNRATSRLHTEGFLARMFAPFVARFGRVDWGRWRIRGLALIFGLIWCSLWGRVYYIQIIKGEDYAKRAKRQHEATERITGTRGSIMDRNGIVLARSVELRSVYVDPKLVENPRVTANTLATILDLPKESVLKLLQKKNTRFVWIARKVDDSMANAVAAAKLKGVGMKTEFGRVYPLRQTAGQLLGFVNIDGKGLEGLERTFDDVLTASSTVMPMARAAGGYRLYLDGGSDANPHGNDVQLSLDTQVQFFAEDALAETVEKNEAQWGGALVVDVASGDILAWAQYPFFNPNTYRQSSPTIWRNRLASDALEPGSTLKPFLVGAALEEKIANANETIFFCEQGEWKTPSITIRDTHKHGWLTVSKILRYSSNIGCAKIGLELGTARYSAYLRNLGFGEPLGLPLAESRGIMRPPNQWREADLMTASFGQSIATTAVQLAEAYLSLAHGGERIPLRLVLSAPNSKALVESENVRAGQAQHVFSPEVATQILNMLGDVVGEGGTGANAGIQGIKVGGKTGTAQKADGKSYGKGRVASFIGFVPIEKPRYLIVVIVDEPQRSPYGSVVAAPVFKHVALRTLAYHGVLADVASDDVKRLTPLALAAGNANADSGITDVEMVPNVVGLPLRQAMEIFAFKGILPSIEGLGQYVERQLPPAGSDWQESSEFTLWLSE